MAKRASKSFLQRNFSEKTPFFAVLMYCLYGYPMDFILLVLKLYPSEVVFSLPLWIKLTMGQLLLLFLCNSCSFFSYAGDVLETNLFSLLLIDKSSHRKVFLKMSQISLGNTCVGVFLNKIVGLRA